MKDGWTTKKLGDLADVIAGQSPPGSYYNTEGRGTPFYQGKKEFNEKFIGLPTAWTMQAKRVAQAGDVLMSVRAPVGPVNFATQKICIGRGLAAIRSRNELDQDFLFYFLLFKRDDISGSGELTEQNTAVAMPAALNGPTELPGISTTDLHAGILAMAHELHEEAGRLKNFGHVKGEKIAHMIEARLGISLGRQPIKDAAGPNDFGHLKKVEARAKKARYFEVKRLAGGGYRIHKLAGFDRLLDKTRAALGERLADVDRLLQWMLPLDSKQAELVATVFAAWNNLLLDGQQPTDEEIVREARDDWHPKKLRIKPEKFFAAVDWLRDQNVVPKGLGLRVEHKTA